MATTLTREQATEALADRPGWALSDDGTAISRRWKTRNFADALTLTNQVGEVAEAANHHPDITLGWGYCSVTFTSHDAGGLTNRDIAAAAQLSGLAP